MRMSWRYFGDILEILKTLEMIWRRIGDFN